MLGNSKRHRSSTWLERRKGSSICHVLSSVQEFVKLELVRRLQKAPVAFLITCRLYLDALNVIGKTFTPEL